MFGEGKGLEAGTKFAIASTYEQFSARWNDLISERIGWIDTWARGLSEFDHLTIIAATKFCVENMIRSHNLPEFKTLCNRQRLGLSLEAPIVSEQEKLAKAILAHCEREHADASSSVIADALLIAAAVLVMKEYKSSGIQWDESAADEGVAGRARMFGRETLHWCKEAELGRGYWVDEAS